MVTGYDMPVFHEYSPLELCGGTAAEHFQAFKCRSQQLKATENVQHEQPIKCSQF